MVSCQQPQTGSPAALQTTKTNLRTFAVQGVIEELSSDGRTVVIKHQEIPNYMPAMTMPFRVKEPRELSSLQPGDEVSFRLRVTDEESSIDQLTRLGPAASGARTKSNLVATNEAAGSTTTKPAFNLSNIPVFTFTNELGQPVSLRQFAGKAVAMTFFFTRCPIPEYCPRLSKNFQEASQKLKAMPGAPTNWHLLSISFDPFDRPAVLKAYAHRYQYDSNHWSFLTGPPEQINELVRGFGISVTPQAGTLFNHSFLTAVFDASGRLQARWPIGGDTSANLVAEIVKAAQNKENGSLTPP